MKQVCLVRHAKAVGKNIGIPDFERSLEPRGVRDSRAMAQRLADDGIMPDLLITSPAYRALETAREFAHQYAIPMEQVVRNEGLYYNRAESFVDIVRQCDNAASLIMLFGHNPTFTEFAELLAPEFEQNMPKAAAVLIAFEIERWSELQPGSGRLVRFDSPKDGRARAERSEKELLTSRVSGAISAVLKDHDPHAASSAESTIQQAAESVVAVFTKAQQK